VDGPGAPGVVRSAYCVRVGAGVGVGVGGSVSWPALGLGLGPWRIIWQNTPPAPAPRRNKSI
jgi:hypothetical protein